MAKLKRKDVAESLDRITGMLGDQYSLLIAMRRDFERQPLSPEIDRLAPLLGGVKAALERMGGNTLPSALTDVLALRDQMAEFRRELADYRAALMRLTNWIDDDVLRPDEDRVGPAPPPKPKRAYNRRKKQTQEDKPQVEISLLDAASHNETSEVEDAP